jgi:hypothetical protein
MLCKQQELQTAQVVMIEITTTEQETEKADENPALAAGSGGSSSR